jgi:hypothetical protein
MLYMNVKRVLYYGFIYPLLAYGIYGDRVQRHSLDKYLPLKTRAAKYRARLKQPESSRYSFKQLWLLTVCSLYIQETMLQKKIVAVQ